MPEISVIVPVYNASRYLEDCLASLAAQDRGDFEAVMVDDGSTDESPELLQSWTRRDRRFRALHVPHAGVSAARNAGAQAAQGTFLFFLDADDLLPRDALTRLMAAAGDADIVCAWHEEFDPDGTTRRFAPDIPPLPQDRVLRRIIEGDSVYNITCNKLYRNAFWRAHHLGYSSSLRIGEDALVNFSAFAAAPRASLVPFVTYRYRIHPASAMRKEEGEYDRHLPFFQDLYRTLSNHQILSRFAGDLLAAMALRYYKQHGLGGLFSGLGPALKAFPPLPGCWGKLQMRGLYPFYYLCTFPARRARWWFRARKRRA